MSTRILVIGATSAIAQSASQQWARQGARIFLAGRNEGRLNILAADLRVRGARVNLRAVDLSQNRCHVELIREAFEWLQGVDVVLIAHGVLGDQKICERNYQAAEQLFQINFLSIVSLLTPIANYMEEARHGSIAVISSVAGDRGRQSNYYYGASKGALNVFLQGLRGRLARVAVRVITVKPGYVATPMTAHLKRTMLFAEPDRVAAGIIRAIVAGRNEVYIPWFWRWIMLPVKLVPQTIFNKMPF